MRKEYQILYFYPEYGQIGIQFDGLQCYNYKAPFRDGSYLSGEELDNYIQSLYPYSQEELNEIYQTLAGAEYIQSLVVVKE